MKLRNFFRIAFGSETEYNGHGVGGEGVIRLLKNKTFNELKGKNVNEFKKVITVYN